MPVATSLDSMMQLTTGEFEVHLVDTLCKVESIMANVQTMITKHATESKALLEKESLRSFPIRELEQTPKRDAIIPASSMVSAVPIDVDWVEQLVENEERCRATLKTSEALAIELMQRFSNCLGDVNQCVIKLKGEVDQSALKLRTDLESANEASATWRAKYISECAERRKVFNQLQELRGNIRVFCRVRPLLPSDGKGSTFNPTFNGEDQNEICVQELKDGTTNQYLKQHTFEFDRVFTHDDGQSKVFAEVEPLVMSVLDGYNVCIFAYGQTGSGKTFTMDGGPDESNSGINQRTLEALFNFATMRKNSIEYKFSVTVLEIYNEQVFDLLSENSDTRSKKLEIRLSKKGGVMVPDAKVVEAQSWKETIQVLEKGRKNRSVGQTDINEHSSRSHCILSIIVEGINTTTKEVFQGKLHLVDLAGSERIHKSKVTGDAQTEALYINKSLTSLGDVISALAKKEKHVPFRNSQLTFLLQDSIGGDCKCLMFVNITPSSNSVQESVNSLNFASRVRRVELGKASKHVKRIDDTRPAA